MRFITITIFAVTGRLVALAIAGPIPNRKANNGIAIPLARHSSSLPSNKSIDLDAIGSHAISVRDKFLRGLDNYEMNMGTKHPFALKRSESGLGRRGTSIPLTISPHRADFWTGEISIGTPPKTLMVQIDTGSADTWVLQTGCNGISTDRDLWDPILSVTSEAYGGPPFRLSYDDATIVEGDQYADNVTIAGFTANHQTFGSATSYTSPVEENGYLDGIMGLAFPSISALGVESLFGSLVGQNELPNPAFSLKLTARSGAELYIGGTNRELYTGDITYTRVTTPGFWEVSMDDVSVHGRKILEHFSVIFDTGSTFIFGDWDRVSELYNAIGGTLKEMRENLGYFELPCDSFPTLVFTINGTPFHIFPSALNLGRMEEGSPNCVCAILGDRSHITKEYWIFGLVFLENLYTVFDYGNLRVGFAQLA